MKFQPENLINDFITENDTEIFVQCCTYSIYYEILIVPKWRKEYETTTWDAKLKFGPGERFLLGTGGALFAPLPEFDPLRFLRLLGGLCASVIRNKNQNNIQWKCQKYMKKIQWFSTKSFSNKIKEGSPYWSGDFVFEKQ